MEVRLQGELGDCQEGLAQRQVLEKERHFHDDGRMTHRK